ncbi:hypothetical protein [Actinoplanes sp. NPDC026623]|uniref:hypothetical protein n=1 Tax=Actinoplanes sp. NPDC026623 TaxID=3155610 RepID=UPI0033CDF8AA
MFFTAKSLAPVVIAAGRGADAEVPGRDPVTGTASGCSGVPAEPGRGAAGRAGASGDEIDAAGAGRCGLAGPSRRVSSMTRYAPGASGSDPGPDGAAPIPGRLAPGSDRAAAGPPPAVAVGSAVAGAERDSAGDAGRVGRVVIPGTAMIGPLSDPAGGSGVASGDGGSAPARGAGGCGSAVTDDPAGPCIVDDSVCVSEKEVCATTGSGPRSRPSLPNGSSISSICHGEEAGRVGAYPSLC